MKPKRLNPSFLETTEQDLGSFLDSEYHSEEVQFILDRSCTPHCVEAITELSGLSIPSLDNLDSYIDFLVKNGANPDSGSSNTEIYAVDDGWYNVAIADLLRLNNFGVVLQRLQYDRSVTDIQKALDAGRVRSKEEAVMLESLAGFGGESKSAWTEAMNAVLENDGFIIASIKIPSSKVPGTWGQHSVVVLDIDNQFVRYFDPDKLVIDRYNDSADEQEIIRSDDSKLIYQQTTEQFLNRMTGEIMNIFPPKKEPNL